MCFEQRRSSGRPVEERHGVLGACAASQGSGSLSLPPIPACAPPAPAPCSARFRSPSLVPDLRTVACLSFSCKSSSIFSC
eukprot:766264-Hanusia_phi.AAC.6